MSITHTIWQVNIAYRICQGCSQARTHLREPDMRAQYPLLGLDRQIQALTAVCRTDARDLAIPRELVCALGIPCSGRMAGA